MVEPAVGAAVADIGTVPIVGTCVVVGGPGGLEAPMNKVGVDCARCGPAANMDMIPLTAEAAEEGFVPAKTPSGSGSVIGLISGGSPAGG